MEHSEIPPNWSKLKFQWLRVSAERAHHFEFEINLYSGQELAGMLEKAGFSDVQLLGSRDGTPYDATAKRLIARARVN